MYWIRDFLWFQMAAYVFLSAAWGVGGWLLAVHVYNLRPLERLVAGLATGFLLFITLSNLLANLVPLQWAFWLAAVAILLSGMIAAWRSTTGRQIPWSDLRYWPTLAVLVALTLLFVLIQRGMAIFDEYLHLPLVSTMASGDIPPHFYLDPAVRFTYHYGLQVWSASLVSQAAFFPWSAFDLSRAVTIAFTGVLGWLWVRRKTHSGLAATLGGFAILFAGGARWLLLLLPPGLLMKLGQNVFPINTGADTGATLIEVLSKSWLIEGGGVMPFPFAYHSGIFVPVFFVLGSTGAMSFMTVLLLMLLNGKQTRPWLHVLVQSLLLASLALSAEHLFAMLLLGLGIALLLRASQIRRVEGKVPWGWLSQHGAILLISGLLSLVQGAFITEFVRGSFARIFNAASPQTNYHGFSLRWPPALTSAHFSEFSIFNPSQLTVLIAELGPVLLLAPIATWFAWKQLRRGQWMTGGVGVAALLNLLFPLFVRYGVDRSITRMPASALWLWLVLGIPAAWFLYLGRSQLLRRLAEAGFLLSIFAGVVIFAVQLISIPTPQLTYFIQDQDAIFAAKYWDRLPQGAQVLDRNAGRAVTIFGRATRAYSGIYQPYPDWEQLVNNPYPREVASSGYDYIYMDNTWWKSLQPSVKSAYQDPCVVLVEELRPEQGNFRQLFDLRACKNP